MNHQREPRGMTMVEMMVVIAIIAVLASILTPAVLHLQRQARLGDMEMLVSRIQRAQESYKAQHGSYLVTNHERKDNNGDNKGERFPLLVPLPNTIDAFWKDYDVDGRRLRRLYMVPGTCPESSCGASHGRPVYISADSNFNNATNTAIINNLRLTEIAYRACPDIRRNRRTMVEILNDHGANITPPLYAETPQLYRGQRNNQGDFDSLTWYNRHVRDVWGRPIWCGELDFGITSPSDSITHENNTLDWIHASVRTDANVRSVFGDVSGWVEINPWRFGMPGDDYGFMDHREWLARGFTEGDLVVFSEGWQPERGRFDFGNAPMTGSRWEAIAPVGGPRKDKWLIIYDNSKDTGMRGNDAGSTINDISPILTKITENLARSNYLNGPGERDHAPGNLSDDEEPPYPKFKIRPGAERAIPPGAKRWAIGRGY